MSLRHHLIGARAHAHVVRQWWQLRQTVYDSRGVFEVADESGGSGILPRNASVERVELLDERYKRVHAANTLGPVIVEGFELLGRAEAAKSLLTALQKCSNSANERSTEAEVTELNKKIAEGEAQAKKADERLTAQGTEIEELKAHLKRTEEDKKQRFALFRYLWLLASVILTASVVTWQTDRLFPDWTKMIGSVPIKALTAIVVFVSGHLVLEWVASRDGRTTRLWPFEQIRRFRAWLWGLVIVGFALGVFGNLYANWIQKKIDQDPSALSNSGPGSSSVPAPGSERK